MAFGIASQLGNFHSSTPLRLCVPCMACPDVNRLCFAQRLDARLHTLDILRGVVDNHSLRTQSESSAALIEPRDSTLRVSMAADRLD